ncbi:class I SAM-dependent methyltransferase [Candidatus Microgenomates bacterium]|nr:class I SAM-dependent methyltransferase [Candidatus Microgenomates bacterium]
MSHGKDSFDKEYYKRFFDKFTKKEFEMYCNWSEGWINFLSKYLPFKKGKGKKLLEIGSSLGYFSYIFANRGFDVTCSDVSEYIVKKASKFQKDVSFKVVNVEREIKLGQKFDYVVGFEVLEHLNNPQKAILNIYSNLKKGGKFVFSTPFPTKRSLSDPTHINVHEKQWWLKIGKEVGFKNRKVVHGTFVPFLYRISKVFSFGLPIKTNLPLVNSTAFFIFKK